MFLSHYFNKSVVAFNLIIYLYFIICPKQQVISKHIFDTICDLMPITNITDI